MDCHGLFIGICMDTNGLQQLAFDVNGSPTFPTCAINLHADELGSKLVMLSQVVSWQI